MSDPEVLLRMVRGLPSSDNPWPVRVVDLQRFALGTRSLSDDQATAANAVSFGGDDGLGFARQTTPITRVTPMELRYRVAPVLAEGVLFAPSVMEHKWAIFFHDDRLLFVRSWQRRLVATASTTTRSGTLEVSSVEGVFTDPQEPPSLTAAIVDFLIRTHALGQVHPAPLPQDLSSDLKQAALWCFGAFGNRASFATPERWDAPPPEQPLRSSPRFHIAIARGDLVGADEQLDAGVPIDLLASDGLSALHWALASPDTTTLRWLVERGLPIDTPSAQGATVLMNAVQSDDADKVKWLLDHGADVDATDQRGFTCLHRAAELGHEDLVRYLLGPGADRDVEAQGHTAASLARNSGHPTVAALLT